MGKSNLIAFALYSFGFFPHNRLRTGDKSKEANNQRSIHKHEIKRNKYYY